MGMCWRVSGTLRVSARVCTYQNLGVYLHALRAGMCKLLSRAGHVFTCVGEFQGLCVYLEVSACRVYLRSSCIEGRACCFMCKLLSRAGHVFICVGAFQPDTDVFAPSSRNRRHAVAPKTEE
jgi:hypothetical protein